MLEESEQTTKGFYEPGIFHLEIATREDLSDFTRLAADPIHAWTVSTFLHEYVHFLQDSTTTHGLLNFIAYIQYLKNAIKQVNDAGQIEFTTPVGISNSFEYQTNDKLRGIYYGNPRCSSQAIRYLGYQTEFVEIATHSGPNIKTPKYTIRYYDEGAHSNESCHFGSFHIKEYMAHAIQKQFAPETVHAAIPYVVVELIVKSEYPALAAKPELIVALCDATLMFYDPPRLFFDAIERMKQCQWTPGGYDSVYAFVFDGITLSWQGQTDTFESLYERTVKMATGEFRDALKADVFRENVRWFEQLMAGALKLRTKHDGIFSKLVSSPNNLSRLFGEVFAEMGTPLMTNALCKGFFHPPGQLSRAAIQPYFPWVFAAIRETFRGKKKCLLHSFCQARPEQQVTDEYCEKGPWERINYRQLCPYAQVWKTWGLSGVKPYTTL